MTDQALYILTFKDESLIKVGYSVDIYRRAKEMAAFERFNLQASYMVSAKNRHWICYLELILKEQFQEERGVPRNPLRGGLTSEIFNASVLPKLLHAIEVFKKVCPGAHYEIKRDLSTYQPVISRQQRKAINAQSLKVASLVTRHSKQNCR